MVKQLSSLDIYHLLKEIRELEGSRVDKIYNLGKEETYIQFHKSNVGKKILRIISGKSIFLTDTKSSDDTPSHFCMILRKNLEGKTIYSIKQLEPERIIQFIFKSKDDIRKIYLELFAKGNIILCNKDDIIIESLLKQKFKDRTILPKSKYQHPVMKYNLFSLTKDINSLFKNAKKDKLVTALATELGLGGIYSEEICLLGNIDKNKDPKKINEKEMTILLKSIKNLIQNKIKAQIMYEDKEAIDVVPFALEVYKDNEKKVFDSFNAALDHFFSNLQLIRKKPSQYENQIIEIKRIIGEQETTLEDFKSKAKENKDKAESIYHNYQLIKEILEEINKAKEKHSWEEIKKRLKGHKVVKEIDVKEKRVVVELLNN